MANFYVKEGVGSVSFDGTIYNEGEKIEMTWKQAKTLDHLVTKTKPSETEETEVVTEDTPETDVKDQPEENKDEDWSDDEDVIDLNALDIDGLKDLATEHKIKFVANIWVDTLRARIAEHFSK